MILAFPTCNALIAVVAACVFSGCASADDAGYDRVLPFDTARVRVVAGPDTVVFTVELARTAEQRTLGLMERRSMPDSAGMLFLYAADQPPSAGFWMYRTRIPLDIAFVDSTGVVVDTKRMSPCEATLPAGCPTYDPGVAYRAALEVNAGVFERHGIARGARLLLADTVN
ncbi:MAG: DUF192 domain-containing protein [Gemmatimonadaceae bacterium]